MKNAIELLLKFGYHFLFIALIFICFYIIVNNNKEQKIIFLNSTSIITSKINGKIDAFKNFTRLREENDSLQRQNARLIRKFIQYDITSGLYKDDTLKVDSIRYDLRAVHICNSTFHLRDNYITLCEGSNKGIEVDDGIVSQNGIVGIVKKVTPNYSLVLSILHSQTKLSCSIYRNLKKGVNSTGVLTWKSDNPKICNLEAIPKHLTLVVGDTIVTSGYSTIFPRGLMVGKIKDFKLAKGSNTYDVNVELYNDPSAWDAIYVIKNKMGKEQLELEKSIEENE